MRTARILLVAVFLPKAIAGSVDVPRSRPQPPSGSPAAWVTRPVTAPHVSHHTFESPAAGMKVSYHLYTPAAHDRDPAGRFPVVYWLHGSGGGLPGITPLAKLFGSAIESGSLPPCLVVFVNGLAEGMYVDWKDGSVRVESVIIQDLIPHIDRAHRTQADRHGRVIDGFSMGGYGAARLGFSHPNLFAGVSLLGAGPLQRDFSEAPRAGPRQRMEIFRRVYGNDPEFFLRVSPWAIAERQAGLLGEVSIRQVIGDRDETLANNRVFHERLQALRIAHQWTVVSGVGHEPQRLIEAMGDAFWSFYRKVFSQLGSRPQLKDVTDSAALGERRERE